MKERKCKYRNCKAMVPGKFDRPDQQYCCRNHKDMERTYRKRDSERNNYKRLVDLTEEEVEKINKIILSNR